MEMALTVVGVVIVAIWFLKGVFRDWRAERDKAEEERNEVLNVKRKIDSRLNDPTERKRVRDKYNKPNKEQ